MLQVGKEKEVGLDSIILLSWINLFFLWWTCFHLKKNCGLSNIKGIANSSSLCWIRIFKMGLSIFMVNRKVRCVNGNTSLHGKGLSLVSSIMFFSFICLAAIVQVYLYFVESCHFSRYTLEMMTQFTVLIKSLAHVLDWVRDGANPIQKHFLDPLSLDHIHFFWSWL